jgi:hypothetical protein
LELLEIDEAGVCVLIFFVKDVDVELERLESFELLVVTIFEVCVVEKVAVIFDWLADDFVESVFCVVGVARVDLMLEDCDEILFVFLTYLLDDIGEVLVCILSFPVSVLVWDLLLYDDSWEELVMVADPVSGDDSRRLVLIEVDVDLLFSVCVEGVFELPVCTELLLWDLIFEDDVWEELVALDDLVDSSDEEDVVMLGILERDLDVFELVLTLLLIFFDSVVEDLVWMVDVRDGLLDSSVEAEKLLLRLAVFTVTVVGRLLDVTKPP